MLRLNLNRVRYEGHRVIEARQHEQLDQLIRAEVPCELSPKPVRKRRGVMQFVCESNEEPIAR